MSLWKVLCKLNFYKSNRIEEQRGEAYLWENCLPPLTRLPGRGEGTSLSPFLRPLRQFRGFSARGPAGDRRTGPAGGNLRSMKRQSLPGTGEQRSRVHRHPAQARGTGREGDGGNTDGCLLHGRPATSTTVWARPGRTGNLSARGRPHGAQPRPDFRQLHPVGHLLVKVRDGRTLAATLGAEKRVSQAGASGAGHAQHSALTAQHLPMPQLLVPPPWASGPMSNARPPRPSLCLLRGAPG